MVSDQLAQRECRRVIIERIAQSDLFNKAPRLRELLSYVAECTLDDRFEDAREQVIAERVFGRRPESNGGQDSIVRAEARNLRKRLELYFQTEGKDEPLVVSMPKGGYVLSFDVRTPPASTLTPPAATAPEVTYQQIVPVEILPGRRQSGYKILCFILAFIAASMGALAWHWYSESAALRNRQIKEAWLPFSALFAHGQSALIVTSDTGFLQISSLAHRRISLDEYMARSYPVIPKMQPPDLVRNWNVYQFTDAREMAVASLISRKNAQYAERIDLRSGHEVELQDFKDHSIILIGSPISNPWAQLYEDKLNFRCDLETDGRIVFRNGSPRSNEPSLYPTVDDIAHNRTYARIAFLPSTADSPPTLLLAGTTAQLTQLAGEFVSDRTRFEGALRSLGIDSGGPPRFFEILVRSNTFVGGAIVPEIVACRSRPAEH